MTSTLSCDDYCRYWVSHNDVFVVKMKLLTAWKRCGEININLKKKDLNEPVSNGKHACPTLDLHSGLMTAVPVSLW